MIMKPDRSNYELWFTDWLDGKLNHNQIEELKLFLNTNPDLLEEMKGLDTIILDPPVSEFPDKNSLKRAPQDISVSQFDNLCIGSLENDLNPEQQAELNYIIDRDPSKKRHFELMQKLKLKPAELTFKYKSNVKRLTVGQQILRLTVISFSAAAGAALLITAYLILQKYVINDKIKYIGQFNSGDTILIETLPAIKMKEASVIYDLTRGTSIDQKPKEESLTFRFNVQQENLNLPYAKSESDSLPIINRELPLTNLVIKMPENILNPNLFSSDNLVAFNQNNIVRFEPDSRSNVDIFLANLFHKTIMGDTVLTYRPVNSFDLAVAGITGLNKLMGWEMELRKTIDRNGEIKSYYFTSRLLKFNAPVKKTINEL